MTSELARRIAFTLGALLLYRIGTYIPVPGINPAAWAEIMHAQDGSILGVFNAGSGGAIERLSILSLGITSYVSAAFVLQLLSLFVTRLRAFKNSGEKGRRKLEGCTRLLTLVMAALQACGIALALQDVPGLVVEPGAQFLLIMPLTLVGGTLFLIWLCDQITLRGIGNGVALILSAA